MQMRLRSARASGIPLMSLRSLSFMTATICVMQALFAWPQEHFEKCFELPQAYPKSNLDTEPRGAKTDRIKPKNFYVPDAVLHRAAEWDIRQLW